MNWKGTIAGLLLFAPSLWGAQNYLLPVQASQELRERDEIPLNPGRPAIPVDCARGSIVVKCLNSNEVAYGYCDSALRPAGGCASEEVARNYPAFHPYGAIPCQGPRDVDTCASVLDAHDVGGNQPACGPGNGQWVCGAWVQTPE